MKLLLNKIITIDIFEFVFDCCEFTKVMYFKSLCEIFVLKLSGIQNVLYNSCEKEAPRKRHNKLYLMKYSDNKDSENTSEKLDFLEFLRKSPLK